MLIAILIINAITLLFVIMAADSAASARREATRTRIDLEEKLKRMEGAHIDMGRSLGRCMYDQRTKELEERRKWSHYDV